ncbi:effector-associated constant component EACC1 [Streptomyces sp. bgisy100]|uniref:effector-associated constant component EACC1 n=1 Tax=Streptomyces sp. bgisy100 TaxID=3413783 RepID=UPI003D72AFE3
MLTFAFDGGSAEADALVRDLADWLNDDEDLSGAVRLRMAPPARGEQGALAQAAELLGAAEPLLSAGVGAVAMWLAERTKSRRVSFRAVRPDGAELRVSAGSPADAAAVREELERFVNDNGRGGGGTDDATRTDDARAGDTQAGDAEAGDTRAGDTRTDGRRTGDGRADGGRSGDGRADGGRSGDGRTDGRGPGA